MPANLNALIRYKTIDSCLYGGRRRWDIDELISACSDALSDSRGRTTSISERTVRDDLRVMRSEILGFNAPIEQIGGLYFYSDPNYSIMSLSITDTGLIEQVINFLQTIRKQINHPELEIILNRLEGATTRKSKLKYSDEELLQESQSTKIEIKKKVSKEKTIRIATKISEVFEINYNYADSPKLHSFVTASSKKTTWGDILKMIP